MSIYIQNIAIALIAVLTFFMGCNSTDSDSETDPQPVSFNSGTIAPGESYSYTFEDEGKIEYYCEFHAPNMEGNITVTNSAETAESDTVIMENEQFQSSSISVAPNTEVVWINNEDVDHTVTRWQSFI